MNLKRASVSSPRISRPLNWPSLNARIRTAASVGVIRQRPDSIPAPGPQPRRRRLGIGAGAWQRARASLSRAPMETGLGGAQRAKVHFIKHQEYI